MEVRRQSKEIIIYRTFCNCQFNTSGAFNLTFTIVLGGKYAEIYEFLTKLARVFVYIAIINLMLWQLVR